MPVAVADEFQTHLRDTSASIDAAIRACLSESTGAPPRLVEAMRYSLDSGGKRLRPALVLWSCELCGGESDAAMPAALAVECVHTFSLIHDDLPAIDNDDFRRGRPSNHKQFGEAAAILAGDAILTLAFEILSRDAKDARTTVAMIRELAEATGSRGLIGGEIDDLESESHPPGVDAVARIHAAKTARLFQAACRLGALSAGADRSQISALSNYGHELGMAFQAADDLLDVTGSFENIGKPVRKDERACKQTYVRAVGMEEARRIAMSHSQSAAEALAPFGDHAARLIALAGYVVERER
ncbi:MAG TPA: farnesyl diphosphate synthase [Phycisphaerae bacterium]|nr:farnesyl diphosphate synthase [Phycisphaerae bacterium]